MWMSSSDVDDALSTLSAPDGAFEEEVFFHDVNWAEVVKKEIARTSTRLGCEGLHERRCT